MTPAVNNNFTNPGPEEVGQYQGGASPFGVQDLIRSVWQYTSEFEDIHTRSVILRGGSNYHPYRGAECRWIENDDTSPDALKDAHDASLLSAYAASGQGVLPDSSTLQ